MMEEKTELRHLPDLPGYGITRDGRIKGPSGRWLACTPAGHGYKMFATGATPQVFWYVHRVVALAYLGEAPSKDHEVAHLNGNPLDNRAENLAWKTRAGNQADRILHGTSNRGERHGMAKLTPQDVEQIRQRYAAGGVLQRELAVEYGVTRENVSQVLRGKRWGHTGDRALVVTGRNHFQARKTHCLRGHEFTPENTYVTSKGVRQCRACRKGDHNQRR